jgi:hypothetical protein
MVPAWRPGRLRGGAGKIAAGQQAPRTAPQEAAPRVQAIPDKELPPAK